MLAKTKLWLIILTAGIAFSTLSVVVAQTGGNLYLPVIMKVEPNALKVMAIGPGGSDVIPRQIVRTNTDRLYLFASQNGSKSIFVYRTPNAGLPNASGNFSAVVTLTESNGNPISVDAVYDGSNFIYVLVNTTNGRIKIYPFDLSQNTFRTAATLFTNGATVNANDLYVGTMGVSGLVDQTGKLHLVYWRSDNRVVHHAYTYNSGTNAFTLVEGPTVVDTSGAANHPSLAVSPLDNSVLVAWVSEATNPRKILARTRASNGTWGAVEAASTAEVWTSTQFGINVDQGPGIVIDASGMVHLTYMQNFDNTGDYGRVHYVTRSGSSWTDTALNFYSHAPAIGLTSSGQISIIGHGHPRNPSGPCQSLDDMCFIQKASGAWGSLQLLLNNPGGTSLDSSPSVKWSVVGFNRPQTLELVFFGVPATPSLDYYHPTLYYARLP